MPTTTVLKAIAVTCRYHPIDNALVDTAVYYSNESFGFGSPLTDTVLKIALQEIQCSMA